MGKDEKFYPITSTCKDDIRAVFIGDKNEKKARKIIKGLDDSEMNYLARKLADDYCDQLYWISLKEIFKSRFMEV